MFNPKRAWRDFWRKVRVEKVVRLTTDDLKYEETESRRIKQLKEKIKALEQQRGYSKGEEAAQTVRANQLEKLLKRKETVNISKLTSERATQISKQQFRGGFSLSRFILALHNGQKKRIWVCSYNMEKRFGEFVDVGIMRDGRLAVLIKTRDKKTVPIITGRSIKDLFRNYAGLGNEVRGGVIRVNLSPEGNFVENVEEHDVPDVVLDGNGNIAVSRLDEDSFIRKLAAKERTIQGLVESHKSLEKVIAHQAEQGQIVELGAELALTRGDSALASLTKQTEQVKGVVSSYATLEKENVMSASSQKLAEEKLEALEMSREKLFAKGKKWFSSDEREAAEEALRSQFEWITENVAKLRPEPEKKPAPTPQAPGVTPYARPTGKPRKITP